MTTGVYRITCAASAKVYVGSAVRIEKRWWNHRTMLRANEHHSIHLQRAWNKHGEAAFTFEVVEECATENLTKTEQKWMDRYGRASLYNMRPKAESQLGFHHSEETKAALRARVISDETRRKMKDGMRRRMDTQEWTALMQRRADQNRGKPVQAALDALSAPGYVRWNSGAKLSDAHRAALSRAHSGKPRPWRIGLKHSEETRKKLSISRRKRPPYSEATKQKMSETHKAIWAARKAAT